MAAESRRRKLEKDNNGGQQEEDRLSSLPECILVDILSQLPLKSAISTSVLSTQWRRVWTQITSVSIQSIRFPKNSDFYASVDSLQSPVICKFSLSFDASGRSGWSSMINIPRINSWFRLICARNIQEIQLSSKSRLFSLPPCIFRTQSLVVLEFGQDFDGELLDAAEFNLPNLKKLRLEVHTFNREILANLIKSCPVLEDLSLNLNFLPSKNVFYILGYNLKRLSLTSRWYYDMREVIINAPKLDYCRFVTRPMELLQVIPHVISPASYYITIPMKEFFEGISNVRYLQLSGLVVDPPILFPNLTHLLYTAYHSTQPLGLITLLHSCPVLEVLVLEVVLMKETSCTWIPPHSVPPGVLTCIKRIEIEIKIRGLEVAFKKLWVNDLVKYMLSVAPLLEKLVINVEGSISKCEKVGQCGEFLFCKELSEYPRSSLRCQIEFSGMAVFASSSDLLKDAK